MKKLIYFQFILSLFGTPFFGWAQEANVDEAHKAIESVVEESTYEFLTGGVHSVTIESTEKALTDKGRTDLSFKKIPFSPDVDQIQILEAFSLTKGQKHLVAMSALVQNKSVSMGKGGLSNSSDLLVPFGNLELGSIVHLKYKRTTKSTLSNRYESTIVGMSSRGFATEKEAYHFKSALPIHYFSNEISKDFLLKESKTATEYLLDVTPLPQARSLGPALGKEYFLIVSNYPSWDETYQSVAMQYENEYKSNIQIPELNRIVAAAKVITSPKKQIEFVSNEFSKIITYSGKWVNANGRFLPQKISDIFKSKTGDCKDFSLLFYFVLRKLQFEVYPAVTVRATPQSQELRSVKMIPNSSIFNHMIVWVKEKSGKVWWIDPTNSKINADYIMSDIKGSPVVILRPTSKIFSLIPETQEITRRMKLEKNIQLIPDNSLVSGKIEVDLGSNIELENFLLQYGKDVFKKVLGAIVDVGNSNGDLNYSKKQTQENVSYEYSLKTKSPLLEKTGKFKILNLPSIALFNLAQLKHLNVGRVYLEEPGETIVRTVISAETIIDSSSSECFAVSPWMEISRTVNLKDKRLEVIDKVTILKRMLEIKTESELEEAHQYLSNLYSCASASQIALWVNPNELTVNQKKEMEDHGPEVDVMTDEEMKQLLEKGSSPGMWNYVSIKSKKFYEKKLEKNPKDFYAKIQMAQAIYNLGYTKGSEHLQSYVIRAKNIINEIKALDPNQPDMLKLSISIALDEGNKNDAVRAFTSYYNLKKATVDSAILGAKIAILNKDLLTCENWLKTAEAMPEAIKSKKQILRTYETLYQLQGRYDLSALKGEELITLSPKNPWVIHNTACDYSIAQNWDKVIELENRALEIAEFGAAKETLSKAYGRKAKDLIGSTQARAPAGTMKAEDKSLNKGSSNSENIEDLLLKALQYNDENQEALTLLVYVFANKYKTSKDPKYISIAKPYIQNAVRKKPDNKSLRDLLMQFNELEKNGH